MAKGNRYRIYKAEQALDKLYFSSPDAAQGWLDWVGRTKWWKQHSTIRHIRLNYPTYHMSGAIKLDEKNGRLDIYATSLEAATLCHESSHLIVWYPGNNPEKDHNAVFAGVYLAVVKRYMGVVCMAKLLEAFEEEGVKWEPYE